MEEVRNVNAPYLHRYALKALRRIEEKEEMKMKRKIERQRNAEFQNLLSQSQLGGAILDSPTMTTQ